MITIINLLYKLLRRVLGLEESQDEIGNNVVAVFGAVDEARIEIADLRQSIEDKLKKIIELLSPEVPASFRITLNGGFMGFSTQVGVAALATATPLDTNNNAVAMPAGASIPAWSASDPSLSLSPSQDGTTCDVTGASPLTGATVTVTAQLADGTSLTGTSDPFDVVATPAPVAVKFGVVLSAKS